MKKIIALLLFVMIMFSLVACDPKTDELQSKIDFLEQELQNQAKMYNELQEMLKQQEQELLKQQGENSEKLQELLKQHQDKLENLMGNPIEFTELSPAYGKREGEIEYAVFSNRNDEDINMFDSFYDYVANQFCAEYSYNFFLIDPGDDEVGWLPHLRTKRYAITAEELSLDGEPISPMINEQMMIYNEVLGDSIEHNFIGVDGYVSWSINLNLYLSPIDEETYDYTDLDFTLKFGRIDGDGAWDTYFNIYYYNRCIGTCYYENKSYVSATWFEKFVKNNVIRGNGV